MSIGQQSADAIVAKKPGNAGGQIFAPAKSAFPPSLAVSEGLKEPDTTQATLHQSA